MIEQINKNTQGVQIFQHSDFGAVRTAGAADNPLFCLTDLCKVLELNPSKVAQRLSSDVLSKYTIIDSLNREQLINFVNEDGLYDVILDSRKPIAKKFRKWVTSEVLPQIRQTGGYIPVQPEETPEQIMAKALLVAQNTIEHSQKQINHLKTEQLFYKNTNSRLFRTTQEQQEQLEEQAPKVAFAEAVESSNQSCLIGELAKILCQNGVNIGQRRLFAYLRDNGYLCSKGELYNQPTQKAITQKLFEIKKSTYNKPDGSVLITSTTKVTGKGQIYFINKFLNPKSESNGTSK